MFHGNGELVRVQHRRFLRIPLLYIQSNCVTRSLCCHSRGEGGRADKQYREPHIVALPHETRPRQTPGDAIIPYN